MHFRHACLGLIIFVVGWGCQPSAEHNDPSSSRLENVSIVVADADYDAWPAVTTAADGSIVVLYTHTDEHMGPDGQIMAVRSADEGQTWGEPYVVYDTPLDERESGVTRLRDGSMVAHTWSTMHTPQSYAAMGEGSYYQQTVDEWVEEVSDDSYIEAADLAGGRVLLSTDGGRSWSKPVPGPDTIHGGVELADGRLMVASYRQSRDFVTINVADRWNGDWEVVASIYSPEPDSLRFGEPSIAQMPGGRIVIMMRTTTKPYNDSDDRCYLWEVYSDDGGETWSEPFQTPLWGFPPHLLVLRDGRLVVTYGHRREPYGQRAAISTDGITWNELDEVVLRDDAPNKDLGYPASIELQDGRVLTVYYQSHASDTLRPAEGPPPSRHKPDILGTIWTVPSIK